jgi:hypothetical protein
VTTSVGHGSGQNITLPFSLFYTTCRPQTFYFHHCYSIILQTSKSVKRSLFGGDNDDRAPIVCGEVPFNPFKRCNTTCADDHDLPEEPEEAPVAAGAAGAAPSADEENAEEYNTFAQRESPVIDLTDSSDDESSVRSYEGALDLRPRAAPAAAAAAAASEGGEGGEGGEGPAPVPTLRQRIRLGIIADGALLAGVKALSKAARAALEDDRDGPRDGVRAAMDRAMEASRVASAAVAASTAAEAAASAARRAERRAAAGAGAGADDSTDDSDDDSDDDSSSEDGTDGTAVTPETIQAQLTTLEEGAASRDEFVRSVMRLIDQTGMYESYGVNAMRERLCSIYHQCYLRRADEEERARGPVWTPPTPAEAARGMTGSLSGRVTIADSMWLDSINHAWMEVNNRFLLHRFATPARTGRSA